MFIIIIQQESYANIKYFIPYGRNHFGSTQAHWALSPFSLVSLGLFFFQCINNRITTMDLMCAGAIIGICESSSNRDLFWVLDDLTTSKMCLCCLATPSTDDIQTAVSVSGLGYSQTYGKQYYILKNNCGCWSSWIVPAMHKCKRQ